MIVFVLVGISDSHTSLYASLSKDNSKVWKTGYLRTEGKKKIKMLKMHMSIQYLYFGL